MNLLAVLAFLQAHQALAYLVAVLVLSHLPLPVQNLVPVHQYPQVQALRRVRLVPVQSQVPAQVPVQNQAHLHPQNLVLAAPQVLRVLVVRVQRVHHLLRAHLRVPHLRV